MFRTLRARAAMRRHGLTVPAMRAGFYDIETEDGPVSVGQSRFNPAWLGELDLSPGVIVEVGAFDGGDCYRLKTAFPDARVIATEADPAQLEKMRSTLEGSGIETHLFPFRVAEAPDEDSKETQEPVPEPKSFTAFCAEADLTEIDFLHLDLGGTTPDFLTGLGDTRPRLIFMDWCLKTFPDGTKAAEVHDLLCDFGYELMADLREDRLYRYAR